MPAHKLAYRTEFKGLPISVENRKGSFRHWYDPGADKHGATKMKYPYGYIKGTLGTDGDAVDVFIGDDDSDEVHIVSQNKAPDFKEFDEQKVFLGFESKEKAKQAYLAHYNNPKFFRNIKTMPLDEFKGKLTSLKGKIIKGALLEMAQSAKISYNIDDSPDLSKRFKSDSQRKYMYVAAKRGDIPQNVVDEFEEKTPKGAKLPEKVKKSEAVETLDKMTKALSARTVGAISKRARAAEAISRYEAERGVPALGTNREQPLNEPPVVPIRTIHNFPSTPIREPEVYKSCSGCGRMCKSTACLTCDARQTKETAPFWKR